MQFRLVYQGSLPSSQGDQSRRKDKHSIRKIIHRQLREVWKVHPALNHLDADSLANNYNRWLPLVTKYNGLACALDILFLRRDMPGGVVKHGGDIDNRLKVLLDALRMPEDGNDVRGLIPTADENPFYCLLHDDYFITELNIITDRLLLPPEGTERIHDVNLILNVRLEIVDIYRADHEFWQGGVKRTV